MQNFHLDAQIDGRKTHLKGGPRSKDGGFRLNIWIKENGSKSLPLVIKGEVNRVGELELIIELHDHFQHIERSSKIWHEYDKKKECTEVLSLISNFSGDK